MRRYFCPICGDEMLSHNSSMWTGMSMQVLKWEQMCNKVDHHFSFKARSEEELYAKGTEFNLPYADYSEALQEDLNK